MIYQTCNIMFHFLSFLEGPFILNEYFFPFLITTNKNSVITQYQKKKTLWTSQ